MAQNMRFDDVAFYAHQCSRQSRRACSRWAAATAASCCRCCARGIDAYGVDASGAHARASLRARRSPRRCRCAAHAPTHAACRSPARRSAACCAPTRWSPTCDRRRCRARSLRGVRDAAGPRRPVRRRCVRPRPVEAQRDFTHGLPAPIRRVHAGAREAHHSRCPTAPTASSAATSSSARDGDVVETIERRRDHPPAHAGRAARRRRSTPASRRITEAWDYGTRPDADGRTVLHAHRRASGDLRLTRPASRPASSRPMPPTIASMTHSPLVWIGLGGVSADDNKTAHRWQDRLHWIMVAVALMSVPAYLLSTSELDPVWHEVASVLDFVILVAFVAELIWMMRVSSFPLRYLLENWLNVVIILGAAAAALGAATEWIAIVRAMRAAVAVLVVVRTAAEFRVLFTRKGAPMLMGIAVLTMLALGALVLLARSRDPDVRRRPLARVHHRRDGRLRRRRADDTGATRLLAVLTVLVGRRADDAVHRARRDVLRRRRETRRCARRCSATSSCVARRDREAARRRGAAAHGGRAPADPRAATGNRRAARRAA